MFFSRDLTFISKWPDFKFFLKIVSDFLWRYFSDTLKKAMYVLKKSGHFEKKTQVTIKKVGSVWKKRARFILAERLTEKSAHFDKKGMLSHN